MSGGANLVMVWEIGDSADPLPATSSVSASFSGALDPSAVALTDVADSVTAWWDVGVGGNPAAKTLWTPNIKLVRVAARSILVSGTPLEVEVLSGVAGTNSGSTEQLSPDDVLLYSWRTNASHLGPTGKLVRTSGRSFMPTPPALQVSANGLLDPTYGANSQNRAEDLMTAIDGTVDWDTAVWSRIGADALYDVVSVRVAKVIATQRRRKPRRQGYFT